MLYIFFLMMLITLSNALFMLAAKNGWTLFFVACIGMIAFFVFYLNLLFYLIRMVVHNNNRASILDYLTILILTPYNIFIVWSQMPSMDDSITYVTGGVLTLTTIIFSFGTLKSLRPTYESITRVNIYDLQNLKDKYRGL